MAAVVTLSEMEVGIARPPPSPPLWPREIKTINKLIGYFRFVCFPSALFLFIFFLSLGCADHSDVAACAFDGDAEPIVDAHRVCDTHSWLQGRHMYLRMSFSF